MQLNDTATMAREFQHRTQMATGICHTKTFQADCLVSSCETAQLLPSDTRAWLQRRQLYDTTGLCCRIDRALLIIWMYCNTSWCMDVWWISVQAGFHQPSDVWLQECAASNRYTCPSSPFLTVQSTRNPKPQLEAGYVEPCLESSRLIVHSCWSRKSYQPSDICVGAEFGPVIHRRVDGILDVNFKEFDKLQPAGEAFLQSC